MLSFWLFTVSLLTVAFLFEWGITYNEIRWWISAQASSEIPDFQRVRLLYDYALSLKFVADLLIYGWYLSVAGFDLVTVLWKRISPELSVEGEEIRHRLDLVACALYFVFALMANALLPLLADVFIHLCLGGEQAYDDQWMTQILTEAISLTLLTIGLLLVSLMERWHPRGAFVLAFALYSGYLLAEQLFDHFRQVLSYKPLPLTPSSKALLQRVGFPPESCLLGPDFNASCSLFRITLGRHLVSMLSDAEQTAILAHELGHWTAWHPWIRLLWHFVLGTLYLGLFYLYRQRGCRPHVPLAISLIAFHLVMAPLERTVFRVLANSISWHHEMEADRFATSLGMGSALLSALTKVTDSMFFGRNVHSTLFGLVYSTHPPNHLRSSLIKS